MYSWHNNIYLKYIFFCNIVIFGQFNVSLLYKDIYLKKIKKFILGGRGRVWGYVLSHNSIKYDASAHQHQLFFSPNYHNFFNEVNLECSLWEFRQSPGFCVCCVATTGPSFFLHLWHMRQNKHYIRRLYTLSRSSLPENTQSQTHMWLFCCDYFLPTFVCWLHEV